MSDEWTYTVQKAIFCQGEGNFGHAISLWRKAASIQPLDNASAFNYLLCLRKTEPTAEIADALFLLLKEGIYKSYSDSMLLMAMLTSFEAGNVERATKTGVFLSQLLSKRRETGTNVWDIPGEPSSVDDKGAAIEERSGLNIISCVAGLISHTSFFSADRRALEWLLRAHQERHEAMKTPDLPSPPEKALWWKMKGESDSAQEMNLTPTWLRYGLSGWPPSGPTSIRWQNGRLEYDLYDSCEPSAERWELFWKKCDELDVWSWPTAIGDPHIIDGLIYNLELQINSRSIVIEGQLCSCPDDFMVKVRKLHRAFQLLVDWDLAEDDDWGLE